MQKEMGHFMDARRIIVTGGKIEDSGTSKMEAEHSATALIFFH